MSAIQVKHVPEDLHEQVRERARERGMTVSQYVLELMRKDLRRPRFDEWVLHRRQRSELGGADAGDLIDDERSEREQVG